MDRGASWATVHGVGHDRAITHTQRPQNSMDESLVVNTHFLFGDDIFPWLF